MQPDPRDTRDAAPLYDFKIGPFCGVDHEHDSSCFKRPAEDRVAATERLLAVAKRPITPRVLRQIEDRIEIMRWSSHETDDEIAVGSLADLFWNGDIPRLIAVVKRALEDGYPV